MQNILSPCNRNCCLDDQNICIGCCRSLEEILQWARANNQQRRQILNRAQRRKQERHDNGHLPGKDDD